MKRVLPHPEYLKIPIHSILLQEKARRLPGFFPLKIERYLKISQKFCSSFFKSLRGLGRRPRT
jgi:hypothetical protein